MSRPPQLVLRDTIQVLSTESIYAVASDVNPSNPTTNAVYYIKGVTADVSTYEIWYTDLLGNQTLFINQQAFVDIVGSSVWSSSVLQNIVFDNNGFLNDGYIYVLTSNWIFRFNNQGVGEMVATIDVTQLYKGNFGFVYGINSDVLYYTTNGGFSTAPETDGGVFKLEIVDGVVGQPEILLDVGDVTRPGFLAIDKYENLYITTYTYSVIKYGLLNSKFISYQFLPIDGITTYKNIIVDTVAERFYAVEVSKYDVYSLNQYDYDGIPVGLPSIIPRDDKTLYDYTIAVLTSQITSLACDKLGSLYFVDSNNNRVRMYSPVASANIPVPVVSTVPVEPVDLPTTVLSDYDVYDTYDVTIGNICFPGNTPIHTDQGIVSIKMVDANIHTINSKQIVAITKTILLKKFLVCFEQHSLGMNYPSQRTLMSGEHKVKYNNKMIEARKFVGCFEGVKVAKYNGQILYNILLDTHETINVNGLVCETLNPNNAIAQIYLNELSKETRSDIIKKMNDTRAYKNVVSNNLIL